jgi:spore germination protein KC
MEKLPTMNKIARSKYLKIVILFLISPLLLSGCWDRREINDLAFVLASAIDKENQLYRLSILIPLPGNMGGAGGGGGGTGGVAPYTVQSELGTTPLEAVANMQLRLSRKIIFAHRRVLLIGEDAAKEGLTILMDSLSRTPENRLSTFVAVTKGKAGDFLSAKVSLERFSAELIRELLQSDATIRTTAKDVITRMNISGQDAYVPYLELIKKNTNEKKTDDIQSTGFSILKAGKQVDVLKEKDALAMRLLMPKFRSYSETLEMDNGKVSFHISNAKTHIKPYLNGNEINFEIKVDSEADVYEFLSNKNTFKEIPKINQLIESHMKTDIVKVIENLKITGSDVVGFGQILNRHFPHKWAKDWEKNWYSLFANAKFKVSVNVDIYRVGMLSENMAKKED